MADIRISQLPVAPSAITGDELVPVVQNGLTVQTTVSAITQSPSLTETFLTVGQQTLLPNSRYFSAGVGLGITDGGALGPYTIAMNGTSASLETASTGVMVKSAANTISARTLSTSGNGISVADGDGVAGNPTFQLTGLALAIANMSGTGLVGLNGSTLSPLTLIGDTNEITIANGNGAGGNPTIGIADNAVFPGVAGVTLPNGTTAERGATQGQIRYNTTNNRFEGNYSTGWQTFGTGDGAITSIAGTTNQIVVSTVGGAATVSIDPDPVIPGTGAIQIPAGATGDRPGGVNGQLRYNSTTGLFEGYANGAWGSIATGGGVTSVGTGVGLLGGPITSTGTIDIDTTVVATLSGTQTLTNKTISGASNTLSNIGNASLTNSSVTIGTDILSLGGTLSTLNGVSISGAANTLSSIGNSSLTNSSLTLGTTTVSLGATATSLAGLSSVAVTGNPTTALELTTKQYVDNIVASGVSYHTPVRLESPDSAGNLNATYNNGTAGVGATLTNAGTQVALTIDGVATIAGDRVLIYNQTNAAENGVYTVTNIGSGSTNWVLTRATDADSYGVGADALDEGSAFYVTAGNTGAGETYVCNTSGTITFGTTPITFAQISAVQVYTAGTGLTLTGTQFSLTTPVTAALGGTGQTSYTTGDLIYASGTTALSKLAAGTNGYLLTMNAGLPSWQPAPASGVTTISFDTTGLTPATATSGAVTVGGTLNVANGGTGLTSVTANRIPYGNGTSALNTSANLTFNGTTLTNTGNAVISDNSANAALRITQTGAGNALLVEDSANPDATPTVIAADGSVSVGSAVGYTFGVSAKPNLQVNGLTNSTSSIGAARWQTGTSPSALVLAKSRSGTVGTQGIVSNGDSIGYVTFDGDDGAAFISAATITAQVDGVPGTNDMPGRLVFSTTADGASSPTERMRIDSAGQVGIGLTTSTGITLRVGKNLTGAASVFGVQSQGTIQSDATTGAYMFRTAPATQAASFTLPTLVHFDAAQGSIGATSAVTNQYGFSANSSLTGATNNYGFYGNIASGTGRYNFYAAGTAANYFAGNVGIGTTTPAVKLAISSTDAILVPVGTTAQRPTGATGYIRYNSDTGGFEGYSGASWGSLGGGNTTTYGLWENNATISANYTITAGNNAVSAGPITVASGITVTVPSGSTWTIV